MPETERHTDQSLLTSFWIVGGSLTALRILTLIFSNADLGPDETQYWYWSRDPAFGYFSKPPVIAWAIGMTTSVFGNSEWAVRLPAPLFHFGTAGFLFLTARMLFDQRIAFWAGLAWLTIPGVILSSFLITTDAPLLFFWSGALFFLFRIAANHAAPLTDFAALGAFIGLGALSKYAMVYFIVAFTLTLALNHHMRRTLFRRELIATAAIAFVAIAPNIWWNAANDFQTVSHTAANANWGATLFKPVKLLSFVGAQFAVAGIVPFAALLWIASQWRRRQADSPDWKFATLLIFALTPLVIVSMQAFISRAHANWAATAYPAVMLLTTAFLFRAGAGWIAKFSIAFHAVLALVFTIGITNFRAADATGLSTATKHIRSWQEQSAAIAALSGNYDAIMIDDRSLMGEMLYYERTTSLDIVAIDPNAHVDNHYEAFKAFDPHRHERVLFVTTRNDAAHVDYRFKNITSLGSQTVQIGVVSRTYHLFDVSGYYGPGAL